MESLIVLFIINRNLKYNECCYAYATKDMAATGSGFLVTDRGIACSSGLMNNQTYVGMI